MINTTADTLVTICTVVYGKQEIASSLNRITLVNYETVEKRIFYLKQSKTSYLGVRDNIYS